MKKALLGFLLILTIFTLAACDNDDNDNATGIKDTNNTETVEKENNDILTELSTQIKNAFK